MEQSIKNVEAIVNLALQRGAFRNIQEATEAINVVAQLRVEATQNANTIKQLNEEYNKAVDNLNTERRENAQLQLQVDEFEDRLGMAEVPKSSPIPKQSELKQGDIIRIKKVADKKEK